MVRAACRGVAVGLTSRACRSSWVFTRDDYDHATWGHGSIRETLSRFFHAFPLLFVGYELEDEDFEGVLAQVRALAGEHPPRHFALVPSGSIQGVRRQGLERAGIRLIEYANPDGQHAEVGRLLEALAASAPSERAAPNPTPPATRALPEHNPFPGLEYFDEDRADLFFGRETEVGEALQLLGETPRGHLRWLQVEGASGTGKSSFARAGLLPKVRLGWVGGSPRQWCVAVMRPSRQPLLSLAQAVLAALRRPNTSLDGLAQDLRTSDTALADFLRRHTPPGQGFLLLVDQFEELFTLAEPEEASAFGDCLTAALEDPDGPLYLVTTVRGDFLGHFGELLPGLERLLPALASRYPLAPMSALGLRAAIQGPAERAGLRWEPGLPERLLEDVSDIEAGLPLLAHALRELWAARSGHTLTHAAYDAFGGTLGALTRSADKLLRTLGPDGSRRARQFLLALVTLQGGKPTRRSLTYAEALEAAGGDDEAERVLARLSGGRDPTQPETAPPPVRLIVVTRSEDEDRIDLVHEALLSRWMTFNRWLEKERQALMRRDDLEAAARAWEGAGSPWKDLPSGAQLAYLRTAAPMTARARKFLKKAKARERGRTLTLVATIAVLVAALVGVSAMAVYSFQQHGLASHRLWQATTVASRIVFDINRKLEPLGVAAEVRLELLDSASKLLHGLRKEAEDDFTLLQTLIAAHNQLGDLARGGDDLTRARKEYEAARALSHQALVLDPAADNARHNLAFSLNGLGGVALTQGSLDEARSFFQQGLEHTQALTKSYPLNASHQHARSVSLNNLGDVALAQGRLDEARSFSQQCFEILQPLVKANPTSPQLKMDQALLELLLARLAHSAKDPRALREHRTNAENLLDELQQNQNTEHSRYKALRTLLSELPR